MRISDWSSDVCSSDLCANGPFAALDPIVVQYWYRNVLEGQPLWAAKPHDMIHVLVPSLVGLAGAILAWRDCAEAADRRNWATIIVALVGAAALSLLVFRSVSTAHIFALPGCAWLGLSARARKSTRLNTRHTCAYRK